MNQPAFGTEDRRRILDVFKERKKKRKQEKKKRQDGDGAPGENGSDSPGKLSQNNSSDGYDDSGAGRGDNRGASSSNGWGSSNKQGPSGTDKQQERHNNQENNGASGQSSIGFRRQQSCPIPARPPPGLGDPSSGGCVSNMNPPPDPSLLTLNDPARQNNQTNPPAIERIQRPASSLILAPDARFIIVPKTEMPDPLPGEANPSLAVPAARHFIGSYYSYLENASSSISIGDLARYYTTKAQKSVSIGGAHSVVQGRNDITTQILSLVGSSFLVRGVVAQDAYDGLGVHILITGTAKTVCNAVAGGVLAFAHSVSLCPIDVASVNVSACPELLGAAESGFLFQIHNDALAFLSGDGIPPPPQPSPPQQHPPPGY